MGDTYKINVTMLKNYANDFKNELNNFINHTYSTFSSSYLKNCSDTYVNRMANELQKLCDGLKKGYQNIDKWWTDYNENIEKLENYLSDNGSVGSISEASIRNSANGLPNLKKYNIKFAGIIPATLVGADYNTSFANNSVVSVVDQFSSLYEDYNILGVDVSDVVDNVVGFVEDVGCEVSETAENLWAGVITWKNNTENWWNNSALPSLKQAAIITWNTLASVGATISTLVVSLVEGLLQFGGAIVDFATILLAGVGSIVTGLVDGGQAIFGAISGNEWSSVTKKMWNGTMGFVSKKFVSGWFDSFYQNTNVGQAMKDTAFGFDITRSISSGVGYISGVVILAIATFGLGAVAGGTAAGGGTATATVTAGSQIAAAAAATTSSQMAVVAGAAGVGKGAQEAWVAGANLTEGLLAGTVTGVWEGIQFGVGAKIGKMNIFGSEGFLKSIGSGEVGTKILNSVGRVILDGIDGGLEGIALPIINSIYKDGYYDENNNYIEFTSDDSLKERFSEIFDDNGGWKTVLTQASVGAASSLFGEALDLGKKIDTNEQLGKKLDDVSINETSDDAMYKLSDKDWGHESIQELAKEYDNISFMSQKTGKALEELFFDDDYVIGIHRCGITSAAEIMPDGLRLTADVSSGSKIPKTDINLAKNISFYEKKDLAFLRFIAELKTGWTYKNGQLPGDVIIVKIPKDELIVDYSNNSFSFKNPDSAIDIDGECPKLKSQYLYGYLKSSKESLSDIKLNVDNLNAKSITNNNGIMEEIEILDDFDESLKEFAAIKKDADGILDDSLDVSHNVHQSDSNNDIALKFERFNQLVNIRNKPEFIDYTTKRRSGEYVKFNPQFEAIEHEFSILEKECNKLVALSKIERFAIKSKNESDFFVQRGDISQKEKIALSEFYGTMLQGRESEINALNLAYSSFAKALDEGNLDALAALKKFTKLKQANPDLVLVTTPDVKISSWSAKNNWIKLQGYVVNKNADGVFFHEFGHCLLDKNFLKKLPIGWEAVIEKAKNISYDSDAMYVIRRNLNDINSRIRNQAEDIFDEQIEKSFGMTRSEYYQKVLNDTTQELGNMSEMSLVTTLKNYGCGDKEINKIMSMPDLAPSELANLKINDEIMTIETELIGTEYSDCLALADMIDAVYEGEMSDAGYLAMGHGSIYYTKDVFNPIHELVANFTQLKLGGKENSLKAVRDLFGEEFYNTLDGIFKMLISDVD